MILGSHNSMTYLPTSKWWLKPFRFMAQCQSKNIEEQFMQGARLFDIRIIFNKDESPSFAHGLMSFTGDVYKTLEELDNIAYNNGVKVYCRVLNERNEHFDLFRKFCMFIQLKYRNIIFYGGNNKKDWKIVFEFVSHGPGCVDKYSSCNFDTKIGTGWHLDDLFPRIYALAFNKYWRKKYKDKDCYLMQDFVGIY